MRSSFIGTYVLDTNAIVNLFRLELGGSRIINKIVAYIPQKILDDELPNVIKKENIIELDYYIKTKPPNIKPISTQDLKQCLKFTDSWIKSKYNFNPLDEGELHCLALSLLLSRKNNSFIALITEESKEAVEIIKKFMQSQKIGILLSPIEFMINLYVRDRLIRENQIRLAIREYKKFILREFRENINDELADLCRLEGMKRGYCEQQCFGNQY